MLHFLILFIFICGLKFITRKSRSRFLSDIVTAIRCLKMFLTFIKEMKLQPSACIFMNNELFHRCFKDNYLRNNASVLIHIARKRHCVYKGLFFFFLVSRFQFTLKTSVSYLAQRQRFAYFINSQDKILCADFTLSTS